MHVCMYACMHACMHACSMYVCICTHTHTHIKSEIVELVSQFATQNCLGFCSKLNLGCEFHTEVATHLPHIKLRTLYTLNIIL